MTLRYTCIQTLPADSDAVNCLSFSPDGLYVAAGYDQGSTMVIDLRTYKRVLWVTWRSRVTALLWHPNRAYVLFTGYGDGRMIAHQFKVVDLVCSFLSSHKAHVDFSETAAF